MLSSVVLFLFISVSRVWGQNLTTEYGLSDVLPTIPNITYYTSYVKSIPSSFSLLSGGNVTILAPSDDAVTDYLASNSGSFNDSEALEALLLYHTIRGAYSLLEFGKGVEFLPTWLTNSQYANVTGGQRIGVYPTGAGIQFESGIKTRSNLTTPNQLFAGDNGAAVIHVIDRVMEFPQNEASTAAETGLTGVVSIQVSSPVSPEVIGALGSTTDWSCFIPNQTIVDLKTLPTDVFFDLQKYHFVHGHVYYSTDLADGLQMQSVQGHNLTVTVAPNGTRYINDAEIIYTDYLTNTGVLHVLSHEVSPNKTDARPDLSAPATSTTLAPPPPPPATESSAAPTSSGSSSSLSTGAKAGIGVGSALGAIFIIGLLILCVRRRMRKRESSHGTVPRDEKYSAAVEMPHPRGSHEVAAPGPGSHWELDSQQSQPRRIYEM